MVMIQAICHVLYYKNGLSLWIIQVIFQVWLVRSILLYNTHTLLDTLIGNRSKKHQSTNTI